jgi:Nucleotide modification associated domain 2
MARLYTYCIPVDDGAAPNPFWGTCTLAICKPAIRRKAQVGDWIVGTGSKRSPIGNIADAIVYAMRVSRVLSMKEYDAWTKEGLKNKIPNLKHQDWRRHLGDSIYDYSTYPPKQRPGVHNASNRKTDLGGLNVLLSDHFFYFGDRPRAIPKRLKSIVHQTQGHRVSLNTPYLAPFLQWLKSLNLKPNRLYGRPPSRLTAHNCLVRSKCAKSDVVCSC